MELDNRVATHEVRIFDKGLGFNLKKRVIIF
jgi:hypothetical protein